MGRYDRNDGQVDEQDASRVEQLLYGWTLGLLRRRRAQSVEFGVTADTNYLQAGQEEICNKHSVMVVSGFA